MRFSIILLILSVSRGYASEGKSKNSSDSTTLSSIIQTTSVSVTPTTPETPITCTCGVFLSGQFKKGSKEQPKGYPGLLRESVGSFPCTNIGNKMCTNKCLESIVEHLHKSADLICGAIGRDAYKERAHLFMKNCKNEWINTNLSAGREYCCKNGKPYKCPLLS